jgi:peroxiredoxin
MSYSPEQPRLGDLLKRTFPEADPVLFQPPAEIRPRSRPLAMPLAAAVVLILVVGSYLAIHKAVGRNSPGSRANAAAGSSDHYGYVRATKKGQLIPAAKRKLAGAVSGTLMGGAPYALSSDAGQVVVLNYFASWCPPCQTETPQFDSIYRQRKGQGVTFVGVDAKDSPKSGAASWVQDKGITFPVLYDPNAKTALQLGGVPIVTLPATVLIDKQGKVAAVYQSSLLPADLNPLLDQLVKETA